MDDDINLEIDEILYDDYFDDDFNDFIISLLPDGPEIIENNINFIDDLDELTSNKLDVCKFNENELLTSNQIFDQLNDELLKDIYLNENIKELMDGGGDDKILPYINASQEFNEWTKKNIKDEIELKERLEILDENLEIKTPIQSFTSRPSSPDIFMLSEDENNNYLTEKCKLTSSCDVVQQRRNEIISKIEELIKSLLQNLVTENAMELLIPDRSKWFNFEMQNGILKLSETASKRKVSTDNLSSKYHFALIIHLLSEIYQLLINKLTCNLRELYYNDPVLYEKQENLNNALKDICYYLQVAPWELGILSSSKGLIAGSLNFILPNNDIIDCSELYQNGTLLPINTTSIDLLYSKAEFVLIVEKDTVFEKLLRNNILTKLDKEIILITGKGYPDINTRIMINKIWKKFHIPIYALVDADPFGIEIMFVYRYGSKGMACNGDYLTCPKLQWIGIHPSEIDILDLPSIPLRKNDIKKINELLQRPYLQDNVRKELEILKKINKKAEIEAVSSLSLNFLINDYIVNKVKTKLFI